MMVCFSAGASWLCSTIGIVCPRSVRTASSPRWFQRYAVVTPQQMKKAINSSRPPARIAGNHPGPSAPPTCSEAAFAAVALVSVALGSVGTGAGSDAEGSSGSGTGTTGKKRVGEEGARGGDALFEFDLQDLHLHQAGGNFDLRDVTDFLADQTLSDRTGDQDFAGVVIFVDRKSTRLNSSHSGESRMPSSA